MMKKLIALILLASGMAAQVPTNGLVGAWLFSGNANDISGSNNNGTVYGATLVADRCGNPNSAYSFNGTSDYIVTLAAGPTGTLSRSVSFWARTSNTVINYPRVSFDYGLNSGNGDTYQINWNYCAQGVGLDLSNQALTYTNSCLANNAWHHIVTVFDATASVVYSTVKFYIDGVLQTQINCNVSGTTAVINTGSTYPITIGRGVTPVRYFLGDLDDFYVYNRALSPAEVLQLYQTCSPAVSGSTLVCSGATSIYSVNAIPGATSYSWTLPNGWTGTSNTNTISVVAGSSPGNIQVTIVTGTCNLMAAAALNVLVNTNGANITASSTSTALCLGQSATLTAGGATSYTWLPGNSTSNTLVITPSVTTTYSLMGSSGSCGGNTVFVQQVVALPTVSASSTHTLLCLYTPNQSSTLTASGAVNYTWMPGNMTGSNVVVTPTATTISTIIYTVTGANMNGCQNTSTVAVKLMVCEGIGENQADLAGISIFPNPSNGEFQVESSVSMPYTIINELGQKITSGILLAGKTKVNLSAYPNGVYLITVNKGDQVKTIRLLKE